MSAGDRWLLPEGVEELLPPEAGRLECLRRAVLDLYRGWGYELVVPPLIEFLESLLTGMGSDLDLQTFKITDQLTGRMMGVRADMTPQVARIDAHRLKRRQPSRLCYLGPVLHTRPNGFASSRSPQQTGAELYGYAGIEADVEVMSLMLETLRLAGIGEVCLDIGHIGIYRGLASRAGLDANADNRLFGLLQRKSTAEIGEFLAQLRIRPKWAGMFLALIELSGGTEVLVAARRELRGAGRPVARAIDSLDRIADLLTKRGVDTAMHFDLAELRGYHYHTGVMFAAYRPGQGQALALGGRYDDVGRVFGRARPATGFSTDLQTLARVGKMPARDRGRILAPAAEDAGLRAAVARLRQRGEAVVVSLPGQAPVAGALGCDRVLVRRTGGWRVQKIESKGT